MRPRSKPRRPSSTTPTSKRRATDAWACAWSTPATSCAPPMPDRSQSWCRRSPLLCCSRCRRIRSTTCARRRSAARSRWSPTTATTAGRSAPARSRRSTTSSIRPPPATASRRRSRTRTRSCGRANSSTPGCWSRPNKTLSSCPTPPSSAVPRACSSGPSPKRTPQRPSRSRSVRRSATSPSSPRASMTASASSPAGNTSCGPMSRSASPDKPQPEENGVS